MKEIESEKHSAFPARFFHYSLPSPAGQPAACTPAAAADKGFPCRAIKGCPAAADTGCGQVISKTGSIADAASVLSLDSAPAPMLVDTLLCMRFCMDSACPASQGRRAEHAGLKA